MNVSITLSSDDWYKVIFALDSYTLDPANEHILPGPECADYADTLFERVSAKRPLRVSDWPVPAAKADDGSAEECSCSACLPAREVIGGL